MIFYVVTNKKLTHCISKDDFFGFYCPENITPCMLWVIYGRTHFSCPLSLSVNSCVPLGFRRWNPSWSSGQNMVWSQTNRLDCSRSAWSYLNVLRGYSFSQFGPTFTHFTEIYFRWAPHPQRPLKGAWKSRFWKVLTETILYYTQGFCGVFYLLGWVPL